jgi:hypothetical protein
MREHSPESEHHERRIAQIEAAAIDVASWSEYKRARLRALYAEAETEAERIRSYSRP